MSGLGGKPIPEIMPLKRIAYLLLIWQAGWTGGGFMNQQPSEPGINKLDYREACGSCHDLPKPKSRTDEQWQDFMMEHRMMAGQDEETAQLYADYLKQMN